MEHLEDAGHRQGERNGSDDPAGQMLPIPPRPHQHDRREEQQHGEHDAWSTQAHPHCLVHAGAHRPGALEPGPDSADDGQRQQPESQAVAAVGGVDVTCRDSAATDSSDHAADPPSDEAPHRADPAADAPEHSGQRRRLLDARASSARGGRLLPGGRRGGPGFRRRATGRRTRRGALPRASPDPGILGGQAFGRRRGLRGGRCPCRCSGFRSAARRRRPGGTGPGLRGVRPGSRRTGVVARSGLRTR